MVINLNKKFVTKKALLEELTDIEIYQMYLPEQFVFNKTILSPLRDEETPSFGFFIGENGEICFKDFLLGAGDCIKFVQLKFGLDFFEAMSKIVLDAGLEGQFIIKNTFKTNINTSIQSKSREKMISTINSFKLGKKRREFNLYDFSFWSLFGITHKTLLKYRVEPVSHLFYGDKIVIADKLAYAFEERKDGNITYKIYQPNNEHYKWINNHNESVWQGWEQLPEKGELLIITKSLKDVMSINDVCGIPAVSLQAEGVMPKEQVIDELKSRFEIIFLLYDNDYDKEINWGREFGAKIATKYDIGQIEIHKSYKSKDFSDLVAAKGKKIAKEVLMELIEIPF